MKRIGFQFNIKQEHLAEYKEHHQHVWSEMLDVLREAGWHNYSLFTGADGVIFGYFESEDSLEIMLARMAATEVNARWQEFMTPFSGTNGRPDEGFTELEGYFHLD